KAAGKCLSAQSKAGKSADPRLLRAAELTNVRARPSTRGWRAAAGSCNTPSLAIPMLVLGDILRRHAAVRGDKIAYAVGADRLTYGAFHARSNQLAHAPPRTGVRPGDRAALLAANRAQYPLGCFAANQLE